jgi:hypothetical protein
MIFYIFHKFLTSFYVPLFYYFVQVFATAFAVKRLPHLLSLYARIHKIFRTIILCSFDDNFVTCSCIRFTLLIVSIIIHVSFIDILYYCIDLPWFSIVNKKYQIFHYQCFPIGFNLIFTKYLIFSNCFKHNHVLFYHNFPSIYTKILDLDLKMTP